VADFGLPYLLNGMSPNNFGSQAAAQISPDAITNVQNQQAAANAFSQNLPSYIQSQNQMSQESASNYNLSSNKAIQASASKKGLLYSGLNQGAQAQNSANIANQQAQNVANNNAQGQTLNSMYQNQAAQSGMQLAGLQQQAAYQQYAGNLAGNQQNKGLLGSLGFN
jgi:hypothetical protein